MSIPKTKKPPLNKRVDTMNLVDYSELKAPMIVVYRSPTDFPGKIIARVWEGATSQATNIYCEYDSLEQCRRDIMSAGFVFHIPRNKTDEIHIVETYFR